MPSPDLYVYAGETGLGHKMRCFAISEAWEGNEKDGLPSSQSSKSIVLVDTYDESRIELIGELQEAGHIVVEMRDDDMASPANLLVKYTHEENKEMGRVRKALLGPAYFPLRSNLLRTNKAVAGRVTIIPGSAGKWWEAIEQNVIAMGMDTEILEEMTPERFADRLAKADIVLSAASVSAWEACSMGKTVFLWQTANNQSASYKTLLGLKLALSFDEGKFPYQINDKQLRSDLQSNCKKWLDGYGASRIVKAIMDLWKGQA